MKLDETVGLLNCVPLFSGLSEEQLNQIALIGKPVVFVEGGDIINKDEPGEAAYLIISGEAARIDGPGIGDAPEPVASGSFVGEMAMLVETHHTSTVRACEKVRALMLQRSSIYRLLEDDVSLAQHFSELLTQRFLMFVDELKSVQSEFEGLLDTDPSSLGDQTGTEGETDEAEVDLEEDSPEDVAEADIKTAV